MPEIGNLTCEQLHALIHSPELKAFDAAMGEAESALGLYIELRRSRNILDSKELERDHKDIILLTKSTVVLSFSALDALVHAVLRRNLQDEQFQKLKYKTFQCSAQIEKAFKHLSIEAGFAKVARHMSCDLFTEQRARESLDHYYDRKGFITHHADVDEHGNKLRFFPSYAHECARFMRSFGHGFHLVTFRS